jgi:hypothetical protein
MASTLARVVHCIRRPQIENAATSKRILEDIMKTKLLALLLLAGGALFAGPRVFVGVGFGGGYGGYVVAPAPPPVVTYYAPPPAPGPGYAWVGGYYYPYYGRYAWRAGNWVRRPYVGAYWVGPHWYAGRYYNGHWRH